MILQRTFLHTFHHALALLINKINNVNIVRNLHLFREYTQQFTASLIKKPFS
jgi:hypothetical protein